MDGEQAALYVVFRIQPKKREIKNKKNSKIVTMMRSNPSDYKERCKRTETYLRENIDDRISRDGVARAVWYEKYRWLRSNAWWTFRNFQHWLNDHDEMVVKSELFGQLEYVAWLRSGRHKKHKKGGSVHDVTRGLGGEAAPRENTESGNDSQEVNDCQ